MSNSEDWKDKLQKVAKEQGINVATSQINPDDTIKSKKFFDRKAIRQTKKIRFDKNTNYNRQAKAPYNFIPLNEKVIEGTKFEKFNTYENGRTTGYIECTIETLTPIYIRACDEIIQDQNEIITRPSSNFFSPTGEAAIPGSSFRGMIRTLVEILSWSKITTEPERVLHFRGLADKSNLRKEYQSQMSPFDASSKSSTYKMNAGYLKKAGVYYQIIPAVRLDGKQYRKFESKQFYQIFKAETIKKEGFSDFKSYFFKSGDEYVVVSGSMPNKKHDWVINPPDFKVKPIKLDNKDVQIYRSDENRAGTDILAELNKHENDLVPCFYVEQENGRISFGHTAMFRLAYEQSFGELLPYSLDDSKEDMTEVIFGTVKENKAIAGRVFFEDAYLINKKTEDVQQDSIPEILATPKPTTFQHYLVQKNDFIQELLHYNSLDTQLRGHKLYWHRNRTGLANELIVDKYSFTAFLNFKNITIPAGIMEEKDKKIRIKGFLRHNDERFRKAVIDYIKMLNIHSQYQNFKYDLVVDKHLFLEFMQRERVSVQFNDLIEKTDNRILIKSVKKIADEKFRTAIEKLNKMMTVQTQYTIIKLIPVGVKFKSKIRFENLLAEELGALLFALQLPANCCHKIGMGKPIGMGSIKITPSLFISERKQRYSSLLAEWTDALSVAPENRINELKQEFVNHIIKNLDNNEKPSTTDLWDTYRLKQLKAMLDWDNTVKKFWNERTRYLEIEHEQEGRKENEYKNRPVLPLPEDVVNYL